MSSHWLLSCFMVSLILCGTCEGKSGSVLSAKYRHGKVQDVTPYEVHKFPLLTTCLQACRHDANCSALQYNVSLVTVRAVRLDGRRRPKAFRRASLRAWAVIHATPMEYAHQGRQSKRQERALFGNFLHKFTLARTQSRYTAFGLHAASG